MQAPCEVEQVVSFDLKTGHLLVDAQANPGVVAVGSDGWVAWVEHGGRALRVVDSSSSAATSTQVQEDGVVSSIPVVGPDFLGPSPQAASTLDQGPVVPRSLRIVGSSVEWLSGSGRHSAPLHQ